MARSGTTRFLALMAECFDRPAFTTEFRSESIPDFKKAITDTIEALNTGVRRLRDGTEVGRIPRKAQLKDAAKRKVVEEVVGLLVELRARYDDFVASRDLRPCGCGDPRCPVFLIEPTPPILHADWHVEQIVDILFDADDAARVEFLGRLLDDRVNFTAYKVGHLAKGSRKGESIESGFEIDRRGIDRIWAA